MTESNESIPYRVARRARDPRLLPLRARISAALAKRKDAVVIDVASGGGLLAAWAAESPSTRRVYAIEDDPLQAEHTRLALSEHPGRDRITIIQTDNLLTYQPPEPWHLMLCDVISAGLLRQPQAPLVNHYLPFAAAGGLVVPEAVSTFGTLLDLDLRQLAGGLTVNTAFEDPQKLALSYRISSPAMLGTVRFDCQVPDGLAACVSIAVHKTGRAQAVVLETRLTFPGADDGIASPYDPVVVPLNQSAYVTERERLTLDFWLPHRLADEAGRATVGPLPAWLDAHISRTP